MATADKQKVAVSKAAPKPFKRKAAALQHDGPLKKLKEKHSNVVKPDGAHNTERYTSVLY